jgi:NAD(P)H-flavin reductase
MMFRIVDCRQVAPKVKWFRIQAPRVAKNRKPGQFAIIRLDERGERIPLTIADVDRKAGTIDLFVQAIGGLATRSPTWPAPSAARRRSRTSGTPFWSVAAWGRP